MYRSIDSATLSVYSELSDLLAAVEAERSLAHLEGGFAEKEVKGKRYLYFQYTTPHGIKRQVYIGPNEGEVAQAMRRRLEARDELRADRDIIDRLAGQLSAGGVPHMDPAPFKVVRRLADSGLFRLGGVLVGTHAFNALAPHLGVTWEHGGRTSDVDIAGARDLSLALPDTPAMDIESDLQALEMGFFPVPAFSPRTPSTSFKVRRSTLRLDLLTPAGREPPFRPVHLERWNAYAETLSYLDYLLEAPLRLPLIARAGAVLANVPDPGRFALHKLIVATTRDTARRDKAIKDLAQAEALLQVMMDTFPGEVKSAGEAMVPYGENYLTAVHRGLERLEGKNPKLAAAVGAEIALGR